MKYTPPEINQPPLWAVLLPYAVFIGLIAALVLMVACAPLVAQSPRTTLDSLADTATIEHPRCLYGLTRPDSTVTFLWVAVPQIDSANAKTASFQACRGVPLAVWHNHLRGWKPLLAPGGGVFKKGTPADSACYLSQQDILSAITELAPPMQVVQVDARVQCWWTKAQIIHGALTHDGIAWFLKPVEGQKTP